MNSQQACVSAEHIDKRVESLSSENSSSPHTPNTVLAHDHDGLTASASAQSLCDDHSNPSNDSNDFQGLRGNVVDERAGGSGSAPHDTKSISGDWNSCLYAPIRGGETQTLPSSSLRGVLMAEEVAAKSDEEEYCDGELKGPAVSVNAGPITGTSIRVRDDEPKLLPSNPLNTPLRASHMSIDASANVAGMQTSDDDTTTHKTWAGSDDFADDGSPTESPFMLQQREQHRASKQEAAARKKQFIAELNALEFARAAIQPEGPETRRQQQMDTYATNSSCTTHSVVVESKRTTNKTVTFTSVTDIIEIPPRLSHEEFQQLMQEGIELALLEAAKKEEEEGQKAMEAFTEQYKYSEQVMTLTSFGFSFGFGQNTSEDVGGYEGGQAANSDVDRPFE